MFELRDSLNGYLIAINICDRICEKGLPHTSNSINLEDHNLVIKTHMKLKLFPAIHPCWCFLLSEFQVSSVVTDRQSWQIGCVWNTSFCKSSHTTIKLLTGINVCPVYPYSSTGILSYS